MACLSITSSIAQTVQPSFPGGQTALESYVQKNIKYPDTAIANGIEGVVTVEFTVNANGSISGAKIVRPVDPDLETEALRIVGSMPKWIPGNNNGTPISATVSLPVKFRLPIDEL